MVLILSVGDNIIARDKYPNDCQYIGSLMYEIHIINKGCIDTLEMQAFTDNSQYYYITYIINKTKEHTDKKLFIYKNGSNEPIEINNRYVNILCDKIVDELYKLNDELIHHVNIINDYANKIIARYNSFTDELNNENPFKGLTKRAN